MKISKVRIQNFRSFDDETISFDGYTSLVGANGAGKSTVLTALNIFFRETENVATNLVVLSKEDFHHCDTTKPIKITITFEDLSQEAQEELKDYVRQNKLTVSAVSEWDEQSQKAEVRQYGERLGIEDFRKYFEMDKVGAKAPELKDLYSKVLQLKFSDLPKATTKPQMEEALRAYEYSHPDQCRLIPSEDQFYGVSRGANKIEKFLQWVYVPAVKDASTEQTESKNSAIGKLLARRVHSQLALDEPVEALKQEVLGKYKNLLNENESKLQQLSLSLNQRFHQWAHDGASLNLQWQDQEKAVMISKPAAEVKAIEGLFKGDLARFGHGLQRSFIFTLLEELSEHTDGGPNLILACEEPELYQHPPQARHLASVLRKLSMQNAQIILCTHSPYFVSGKTFENIRLARKDGNGNTHIKQATYEKVSTVIAAATGDAPAKSGGMAAKIEQEMETPMNEMFFSDFRVFVEGFEDIAYISSYLSLLDKWDVFRSLGGHLVPVQGKSHLVQSLAIANEFSLPYFVVFDCDGNTPADDPADPKKQTGRRQQHEKENLAIAKLANLKEPEAFPVGVVREAYLAAWPTNLSDIIEAEIGKGKLSQIKDKVRFTHGINTPDMNKNGLFIGYVMAEAWDQNLQSSTLITLCEDIINFGKLVNAPVAKAVEVPQPISPSEIVGAESVPLFGSSKPI